MVKTSGDGKIISRFWPSDFSVRHKLFETFQGKPAVLGAAVIRQKELIQTVGNLPSPADEQTQLEVLLALSGTAFERPFTEFLEDHEVLKGLHELANGELRGKDARVILFADGEAGRHAIISLPDERGRTQSWIPLADFQLARAVHARFAARLKVAGASVITGSHSPSRSRQVVGATRARPETTRRPAPASTDRPVVVAAFGRTPLKVNMLATTETLQRLGLHL